MGTSGERGRVELRVVLEGAPPDWATKAVKRLLGAESVEVWRRDGDPPPVADDGAPAHASEEAEEEGENVHRCPECGKDFDSPQALGGHKAAHEEGSYDCPKCGKDFDSPKALGGHMGWHSKREQRAKADGNGEPTPNEKSFGRFAADVPGRVTPSARE